MTIPIDEPRRAQVKEIFLDLLDMPVELRAAELDRRAAGDPALRAAVSSLLDAMQQSEKFMAGPTVESDRISETDTPHRQIGPYKILQVIGEGGFGTVYMAEQESPVRRRVALKLIKLGMDSKQVIARFEAERQALAMMDHANIAKVFDAGATEQGRPYFVMELVKGIPITDYCDKNNLSIRQRLDLFAQVCQAVQHAHQKGVIHRDIKPNNILVSGQDDPAAPGLAKIIDFGIAKATQARLTEKTLFTEFRQLIGTPEYMSPEQADGSLDIDTRSDVYSLGVLLYELLTGTTPFDARDLRSKAYGEIQRVIREVEPPRPSTRLSTMKDTLPSVAARRQVEPRRLGTIVRGDLDWIVMKALEKDRTRRYETANGLAADVQRYLANEPVAATPPSAGYRIRKFARRHRLGIGMAAVVMLLVAGGLVGTSIGFVNARRERDAAIRARNEAEAARQAEAEARAYETGTDKFLTDMFGSIDPTESRGKPVLVTDILDRAVRRLDTEPPKHRKAEASLRILFARAYHSLGVLQGAHTQARRAAELYQSEWGESDIRTARVFNELGLICFDYGRFDEAEVTFVKAVTIYRKVNGPDHAETINCENSLAELLIKRGKYDEADKLLAELLPRVRRVSGADSDDVLAVLSVISNVRSEQGRALEAEQITREGFESARRRLGDDHPYTLTFANNLSDLLRAQGRVAEAEPLQRQSLETARRVFGLDHPSTLTLMNNLALSLEAMQRYDDAERLYLDLIERRRRILGDDHPGTLMARSNYALVLQDTGRLNEAEAVFVDVVERSTRTVGRDDANTMSWTGNIAWVRVQRGDLGGAEAIYRELVPRARQVLGAKHPLTVSATMRYGHCLGLQNRWGDAEPLLADAFASATAVGIAARQAGYAANYGICLTKLGKMAEAIPILLNADESLARAPRTDPAAQKHVIDAMITALDTLGRADEAKTWRARRPLPPTTLGT